MEVRIKFSADVTLTGETLEKIKDKWINMNLFSDEANDNGVSFNEHLLIEDANTGEDVSYEFWHKDDE